MPGRRRAQQNRTHRDTNTSLRYALDQIPTSEMTAQQKSNFLDHIAKVFFFILQEFMNNQQNIPPRRNIPDFPEAFHQSLFDLQVLTVNFMENSTEEHYNLGARIMTLMATASTEDENRILQFALQDLHQRCPQTKRPSSSAPIRWLWHKHQDSLRRQTIELSAVQTFFDIT